MRTELGKNTLLSLVAVATCLSAQQARAEGGPDEHGPENTSSSQKTASKGAAAADTNNAEIIVTAQRREQAITKVPMSIVAFTTRALEQRGVRNISDLARVTPGVSLQRTARYTASQANISIRGVFSGAGSPTTGIYIDDTPVQTRIDTSQGATNPYPMVFDLARIEVLRGPQGTLFGSGSVGGAVRFITPTPSLTERQIYARGELSTISGGAANYEAGAAFGVPIVNDVVGLRASIWSRRDGGWVDRVVEDSTPRNGTVVDPNANWSRSLVAQAALRLAPSDDLSITPSVFCQRVYTHDTSVYGEDISGDGQFRQSYVFRQPSRDKFVLPALRIEYEFGGAKLISNTSYFQRTVRNTLDTTYQDLGVRAAVAQPRPLALDGINSMGRADVDQHSISQEVRLQNNRPDSFLNWIVGAYYSRAKINNRFDIASPDLLTVINYRRPANAKCASVAACFFGVGLYQSLYSVVANSSVTDKQAAIFGQLDAKVTSKLTLTAGLRYSRLEFNGDFFQAGPNVVSNGTSFVIKQKSRPLTPKFAVSYQADQHNLFYASVARGFRAGTGTGALGANCAADANALGLSLNPREIKPDNVWSYEIGSKNRLAGDRILVEASIFQIDWHGIQTNFTLPACRIPTTANLGNARIRGFDFSATLRPFTGLVFNASVSYNDNEYTTTTSGSGGRIIRSAGQPIGGPPWTINLSSQYDFEVNGLNAYLYAQYVHTSHDDRPLDLASAATDPLIPRPPATNDVNARVGVRHGDFDFSLFVKNLTNSHPELARYRTSTSVTYFTGLTTVPRTFGATVTYHLN